MESAMTNTVFITTHGNKYYITDKEIELAFKELINAGYTPIESADHALSLVIARIESDELSAEDFIYGKSDFQSELAFLAQFNSRSVVSL
jgi:hypothetical protein